MCEISNTMGNPAITGYVLHYHYEKSQYCMILHALSSGGARILEQVGPAAGPKVVW